MYLITHGRDQSPSQFRRCLSQSEGSFFINMGAIEVLLTQADIYFYSYLREVRMKSEEVQ